MEDNNPKLQKFRRRADAYVRIMETARILKDDDHHIHTHSQDNTDSIQRMAGVRRLQTYVKHDRAVPMSLLEP